MRAQKKTISEYEREVKEMIMNVAREGRAPASSVELYWIRADMISVIDRVKKLEKRLAQIENKKKKK